MPKKKRAQESKLVQRARLKLKKQLAQESKMVTAKALNTMTKAIHKRLERGKDERIPLKDKSIAIFDENEHPSVVSSKFVKRLRSDLKEEISEESSLAGRVKRKDSE